VGNVDQAPSVQPDSQGARPGASSPWWKDPVVVLGATVPVVILGSFFAYLLWPSARPNTGALAAQDAGGLAPAPKVGAIQTRNPKIPIEVSYPTVQDVVGFMDTKRTVTIRLNMKVSEEILREIALEVKAKEIKQYEYTRIWFFLPGKGPGMGPGNEHRWASADFDAGLRVWIDGYSIEDEKAMRTLPLELPIGSQSLGTWLLDDGYAKTRQTIYILKGRVFYHVQYAGTPETSAIEMDEIPDERGRLLKMRNGSADRYLIKANGQLELYTGSGKLLYQVDRLDPPPPDR
jgi:hypothetical protein